MYLLAAISIGFLGSAHCLGMCGPFLLAVNQGRQSWKNDVLHHSGRLLTYIFFGVIAGAMGQTFSLLGLQQGFSITLGIVMITSVALVMVGRQFHEVESALGRVAIRFSSWIRQAGFTQTQIRFLSGMSNGLLPCGLVYLALAGAANTFTPWDGAIFMFAFGAGTLPALIAVSKFGQLIRPSIRTKIRKLVPITVFVMGALLIVRGANLGIPYMSPAADSEAHQPAHCD
ncbi:MAG: sulfite exporter TauE/SafE family protein [Salibacteraceae bacterium]